MTLYWKKLFGGVAGLGGTGTTQRQARPCQDWFHFSVSFSSSHFVPLRKKKIIEKYEERKQAEEGHRATPTLRVGFRRDMRPALAIRPFYFQTLLLDLTAKEATPRPENPVLVTAEE